MFVVSTDSALPAEQAWRRLVDWPAHGRGVPLTTVERRTPAPDGLGTIFVARTAVGRFGFDDPMQVVAWTPPWHCRIEKRGRVLHGWAELTVAPHGAGCRVTWREQLRPAGLPRRLAPLVDPVAALAGRLLFGRLLRRLLAGPVD